MNANSNSPHPSGTSPSEEEYEQFARAAGAALRRPAPDDVVERLQRARRRRHLARASIAGACLLLVGVGATVLTRQSGKAVVPSDSTVNTLSQAVVSSPTTAATAPPTTAADPGAPHAVSFALEDETFTNFNNALLVPAQQHAIVAGDLEGKLFGGRVNSLETFVGLAWFEGSVLPCGKGGLAMSFVKADDATFRWTILPLMGQGALVKAGGGGTFTATDGYQGTITCVDPAAAAPLRLLQPPPADGKTVEMAPFEPYKEIASYTALSDGFQTPPTVKVHQVVDKDNQAYTYAELIVPNPTAQAAPDTTRQQVSVALFMGSDAYCATGKTVQTRVTIDHFLYSNFDLSWDIVSAASGGAIGGGDSTGSTVRCP